MLENYFIEKQLWNSRNKSS